MRVDLCPTTKASDEVEKAAHTSLRAELKELSAGIARLQVVVQPHKGVKQGEQIGHQCQVTASRFGQGVIMETVTNDCPKNAVRAAILNLAKRLDEIALKRSLATTALAD